MREWRLFVDDERVGPQLKEWDFAPNYEQAIKLIETNGIPIDMSLDYNIWTGLIQGDEFVEWLGLYIQKGNSLPTGFKYSIHSTSAYGRELMHLAMRRITGKEAVYLKQWW